MTNVDVLKNKISEIQKYFQLLKNYQNVKKDIQDFTFFIEEIKEKQRYI